MSDLTDYFNEEVEELKTNKFKLLPCPHKTVFYGSSSFRLWHNMNENLGREDIINLGFGGSTLEAANFYFESLVLPFQPKSIVFYGGDNDIGNGDTPQIIHRNFFKFLRKVETHLGSDYPFTFVSIKPSIERAHMITDIQESNRLIQEEIERWTNKHYIDIHYNMLNPDGSVKPELFVEDGLHMNQSGYDIWTKAILQKQNEIF